MALTLQKKAALELVTPIVDGEATGEEEKAFFKYIESHWDVRLRYEEEEWLKQRVREQYPRKRLPVQARLNVEQMIQKLAEEERQSQSLSGNIDHGDNALNAPFIREITGLFGLKQPRITVVEVPQKQR
ncbi:MAG: hypothetical protein WD097_03510 [Balneolales bacterium]